jgi:hypothetical protein
MEFVTFHVAAWDDQWVLTLSLAEHQVFHYIATGPDFVNGNSFAERNSILWPIRMKMDMSQIDSILEKFVSDGKIKIQNGVIWVINGIHYQKLGGLNLCKAIERIKGLFENKAPKLVKECWEMYRPDTPYLPRVHPVSTPCTPRADGEVANISYHNITEHNNKKPLTPFLPKPSQSSLLPETGANMDSSSTKKKPEQSEVITKRNLELQPLAERFAEIVSKAESTAGITRRADNATEKIINTVRALVDIDKYRPSEIELCARWAFLYSGDEKFNLQNLANIGNWRKQWRGGRAFTVTFKKWEVAGRPESPAAAQPRESRQGGRGSVAGTENTELGR